MKIITGLFENMVIQRNARGVSDQFVTGEVEAVGLLTALISGKTKTLLKLGKVGAGSFSVRLKGLPVGGPYRIVLQLVGRAGKVLESVAVRNVLVGDVWVLAGQSNMEGCGLLKYSLRPNPRIRNFYMNDTWAVAKDPLHGSWSAVDAVHHDLGAGYTQTIGPPIGSGLALSFGAAMLKATAVPQGFIACAHGGTSMQQWDPALKVKGGASLYGAMLRRVVKNGRRVAGVLWHQGCSETAHENHAPYTSRMKALVANMRDDFGSPTLPFVMAQIARFVYGNQMTDGSGYMAIRELQRHLPEHIQGLAVVPTIDLPIDDIIHLSGDGLNALGRRMADAMQHLTSRGKSGHAPIGFKRAWIEPGRKNDPPKFTIVVEFDNVVGELTVPGRPNGFYVGSFEQAVMHYDTRLDGNRVLLHVEVMQNQPIKDVTLSYGFGLVPFCNITDKANRSLPAFGPLPLPWAPEAS